MDLFVIYSGAVTNLWIDILLLPVNSIYHDLKMTGSEGFKRKADNLQKVSA